MHAHTTLKLTSLQESVWSIWNSASDRTPVQALDSRSWLELREMIRDSGTMQVLKRVRMRMQRTVRVLYMIHCTFRDGFQVSCGSRHEHLLA